MATPQEKIAVLNKLLKVQRDLLDAGASAKEADAEREVFAELAAGLVQENDQLKSVGKAADPVAVDVAAKPAVK